MAAKQHFKNLDGLRFFAAVFVVISHTESMKDMFKLPSLHQYKFFQDCGTLAVKFFFVLSGFLITYLLLQEKDEKETQSKNINVANFYKKRRQLYLFTRSVFLDCNNTIYLPLQKQQSHYYRI